jgi:hypothetical protein
MKRILTARRNEGDLLELAGLLTESVDGDEVVVESAELCKEAYAALGQGACGPITITIDKAAVEAERAKIRDEHAVAALGRLTGAERISPRSAGFGTPGPTPGSRTFDAPDVGHRQTTCDEKVFE